LRAEKRARNALAKSRQPLVVTPTPIKHRHDLLCDGELSPAEMTMDELRLGRGLNEDGGAPLGGRRKVPQRIQTAITRELQKRLLSEFNKHGLDAINTIVDIMYGGEGAQTSHGQKDGVKKLEAAKYIIERIVGKIPDKMEVTQTVTVWDEMQHDVELFIDVEAIDVPETEPTPRARGPRTRPTRKAFLED
jgi:hypothetical protein